MIPDHYLVSIRNRTFSGICDVSLLLLRRYLPVLSLALAVGAAPWILFNALYLRALYPQPGAIDHALTGWIQLALVFIESQIATAVMTAWLGRAMFSPDSSFTSALRDVLGRIGPLAWVSLVLRPIFLPFLLGWWIGSQSGILMAEGTSLLLPIAAAVWIMRIRFSRPFAVEIILLERTPFRASVDSGEVTFGRRSRNLHAFASGLLLSRNLQTTFVLAALLVMVYGMLMFLDQVLVTGADQSAAARYWFRELALWIVTGFAAIVRFVSYLDLRARQEGWDAELKIRAEAARLDRS